MWEGLGSSQRQAAGILPLLGLDASSVPGSVFPSKVSLPQAMLLSVTKICCQSLLLKRKFHVAWSYLFRLAPNPPLQLIHLYSSTVTPIVLTRSPCRYVYLQESLWDDWNVIKKWRPDVFSQIMFSRLQQSFQKGGEGRETRENLYCSALTREFPKEYTRKNLDFALFFFLLHWSFKWLEMAVKQSGLSVPLCKASRCVFPQCTCFVAQPVQKGGKKKRKIRGKKS